MALRILLVMVFHAHSPYTETYFYHNFYCTYGCKNRQLYFVLYLASEYYCLTGVFILGSLYSTPEAWSCRTKFPREVTYRIWVIIGTSFSPLILTKRNTLYHQHREDWKTKQNKTKKQQQQQQTNKTKQTKIETNKRNNQTIKQTKKPLTLEFVV